MKSIYIPRNYIGENRWACYLANRISRHTDKVILVICESQQSRKRLKATLVKYLEEVEILAQDRIVSNGNEIRFKLTSSPESQFMGIHTDAVYLNDLPSPKTLDYLETHIRDGFL